MEDDPLLYSLSRKQINDIYQSRVVPAVGSEGPALSNPKFIIVGGQQGSGKTTALNAMANSLGSESTQRLTVDSLNSYYPGYTAAAQVDSIRAQKETGNTPGQWGAKLMERAFDNRHNIVLELASPSAMNELLQNAKMHGYQTEVQVISASHDKSWTSVVSRYEHGLATKADDPRFVDRASHNAMYEQWPAAIYATEKTKLADSITIRSRDDTVHYENRLVAGANGMQEYAKPERAMESLIMSRHGPLNEQERDGLIKAWDQNIKSPHLAKALPTEMQDFGNDREQITAFARSPASQFDPQNRNTHKSQDAAIDWNDRVVAEAVNAYTVGDRSKDMQDRVQAFINVAQDISVKALENAHAYEQGRAAPVRPPAEGNSQSPPQQQTPPDQSQAQQNTQGGKTRGSR